MKKQFSSTSFLSPLHYVPFVLQLPKLPAKELRQAALYKLKNIYPGGLDGVTIFLQKNGNNRGSFIVFAVEEQFVTKKMLFPSLALRTGIGKKDGCAVFYADGYAECCRFENGMLTEIQPVLTQERDSLEKSVSSFCGDREPVFVIDVRGGNQVRLQESDCVLRVSSPLPTERIVLLGILLLSILILLLMLLWQGRTIRQERLSHQINAERAAALKSKQEQEALSKLSSLESSYKAMAGNGVTVFDALLTIAGNMPTDARIETVSVSGLAFSFDARSKNALDVLKRFESCEKVQDCILHQVRPDDGEEFYSVSGTLKPQLSATDIEASVSERIEWYENALKALRERQSVTEHLTVSSTGDYAKKLVKQYGCTLRSYQYVQNYKTSELEFSLEAENAKLFDLIATMCDRNQLFDISSAQIRTEKSGGITALIRMTAGSFEDGGVDYEPLVAGKIIAPEKDVVGKVAKCFVITKKQRLPIPVTPLQPVKSSPDPVVQALPSWYRYVGMYGSQLYVKDERSGAMLKFMLGKAGNMGCRKNDDGSYILAIDNKEYKMAVGK